MLRNGEWYSVPEAYAEYPNPFTCQIASPALRGKEKPDLVYKKDQLTFRSFHVWYDYKAASQQVLDSWEDKRMTGFKLTWRIEKPSSDIEVTPAFNDYEKLSHTWLVKMVQLAKYLRVKNTLTEEQILDKVVQWKLNNISALGGICSNGQIK